MSEIENINHAVDFAALEMGVDRRYANSFNPGYDGPWQQKLRETVTFVERRVSLTLYGLIDGSSSVGFDGDAAQHSISSYGGEAREKHQESTGALAYAHHGLSRLLDGTNNDHAQRALEELNEAREASNRTDERMGEISGALSLELNARLQELMEALGTAANRVYLPFIGDGELGTVADITTLRPDDVKSSAYRADVSRPLQEGFELIDGYRNNQLLGGGNA